MIRPANLQDITGIMDILERHLIQNLSCKDKNELEERGFLLFSFSKEEIKKFILDKYKSIFLVAIENEKVIGYALSYDLNQQPKSHHKILYHHHIAVQPGKKGVGKLLMQAIIKEAAVRQYEEIICDISHAPNMNRASIQFHKKFGFVLVNQHKKENIELGVYRLRCKPSDLI